MKKGIILFKNLDLSKQSYPVVIIQTGDLFSNLTTGPFENTEELTAYIEKHNLQNNHDLFEITKLHKPN